LAECALQEQIDMHETTAGGVEARPEQRGESLEKKNNNKGSKERDRRGRWVRAAKGLRKSRNFEPCPREKED